jgi:hypothetical protein
MTAGSVVVLLVPSSPEIVRDDGCCSRRHGSIGVLSFCSHREGTAARVGAKGRPNGFRFTRAVKAAERG